MPRSPALCSGRILVLVLAALLNVYRSPAGALEKRAPPAPTQAHEHSPEPGKPPRRLAATEKLLPGPVEEMRQAILSAEQPWRSMPNSVKVTRERGEQLFHFTLFPEERKMHAL